MGFYEVSFALRDGNMNIGPSDGVVMLKIIDVEEVILYNSTFQVRSDDFKNIDDYINGGKLIGYIWRIPSANVSHGVSNAMGFGEAQITFLSFGGLSATEIFNHVLIPEVGCVLEVAFIFQDEV